MNVLDRLIPGKLRSLNHSGNRHAVDTKPPLLPFPTFEERWKAAAISEDDEKNRFIGKEIISAIAEIPAGFNVPVGIPLTPEDITASSFPQAFKDAVLDYHRIRANLAGQTRLRADGRLFIYQKPWMGVVLERDANAYLAFKIANPDSITTAKRRSQEEDGICLFLTAKGELCWYSRFASDASTERQNGFKPIDFFEPAGGLDEFEIARTFLSLVTGKPASPV